MNIVKVMNSAAFVNYVKPGLEMVEMETEGVLCTSGDPTSTTLRVGSNAGGFEGQTKQTATRKY